MFTGVVTDIGRVRAVTDNGDTRFEFETDYDTRTIDLGASIAVAGACLTVVDKGPGWFAVQASAETLRRTTLGGLRQGAAVNLERPLAAGAELGGHFVLGHVDGTGTVRECVPEGESLRVVVEAPPDLTKYIAPKGSVTIDGVALTVNAVDDGRFSVNIIPMTARRTTLGSLAPGTRVNLEVDVLARYLERLVQSGGWR
ncbi:MAG: riboflavin synthase [Alphaproteobacteria bacterium]